MELRVKRFESGIDNGVWDDFVASAMNATFLFKRSFMDYHKDRFQDHSVMVFDEKDALLACLPANQKGTDEVVSHQGLTYGGFMMKKEAKLPVQMEVFKSVLRYYHEAGVKQLTYKHFPRFYNTFQTDEIEYCLFLAGASLFRRDTAIAVDYHCRIPYAGNIRREARKAEKNGVMIRESDDFKGFWKQVLEPNLEARFGVKPVHSLEEISRLKEAFNKEIRLFVAVDTNEQVLAGTVMFETPTVAHSQYISATDEGRREGALNLLFIKLLDEYFAEQRFFDFGTANEDGGKSVNPGLLAWKERMGGRTYSHDFYRIETQSYQLL
ncbi:MAG TPA: GNAT family N-acetyltransferase [Cryomorphaceae bacterium]|nr:GNAT family N-acetyltransferase [Owenweeksia sp.]MBF98728.1 GNAT family N-acetyltransferase [Owenweeksia sp.]HAD96819.1 GNAT family N-acetyltransferase [Cryomorphaceae bacterium]HBF19631.1 GNAT family N-acetyltransferase [Cryomorphaceae bacterium]|tara:strand:- start:1914 stop:2885 length:972 start_codon:yes stop_codon:yes gene_type:complete